MIDEGRVYRVLHARAAKLLQLLLREGAPLVKVLLTLVVSRSLLR